MAHTLIPVQQLRRRSLASLVTRMFGTISLISLFTTAAHYRQVRGRERERERERERQRRGGGDDDHYDDKLYGTLLRDNHVT